MVGRDPDIFLKFDTLGTFEKISEKRVQFCKQIGRAYFTFAY